MHLRRQLLKWHQALGFVTLVALAATDIIGTLSYYDKYTANGTDTGTFTTYHEGLGIGTAGLFGITGILALSAPNPYPKPVKFDAALVHKLSMLMASICFATQIVMGPIMAVSGRQAIPARHGAGASGRRLRRLRVHGRRHLGLRLLR